MDMRGDKRFQDGMFSYVSLQQRFPEDHPLRAVRKLTDTVLRRCGGCRCQGRDNEQLPAFCS
jgi:hypothetical protein